MKKIDYNKSKNISEFDKHHIIKLLKEHGDKAATFDSNYSKILFYSYFMREFYAEKDYENSKFLANYITGVINTAPATLKDCVNSAFQLLTIDCYHIKMFKETRKEVIVSFLFQKFKQILYDEFYLFQQESPTLKVAHQMNITNIHWFLYKITEKVAEKIKKRKYNNCDEVEEEAIIYVDEDFEIMAKSPSNLTEAIDHLLSEVESEIFNLLKFNKDEPFELYVASAFYNIYAVFYYKWYLEYDQSPLRKWFRENKKMEDSHYICYYIIETFIITLMLKKSLQ